MKCSTGPIRLVLGLCVALGVTAPLAFGANPDDVARFTSTHQCFGCDLSDANFAGIQAPKARLGNANLARASFYGGSLRAADLSGAMLDGANLEMTDLTGALGAILSGARTDSRTTCPNGHAGPCS